ncbi:murein L,D-transpeptidase catalytic domain-containing protein [Qipengyuania atrilutea]|uniref:Murein L,D-transpeptidase catalytic domain family protein n=1 Tax=Qipengyuania atrilutea TaxID=2744473 RepID=A0A850H4L3_9SPHN|nr:murein L,D-transpeptidase catalytic domain family protein [Actirhodobacter atriluteus]NVD45122.1 murein L,D-transpeptidase catalytic domain family protein [Actirhodobacter atriluteus]
MKRRDLILGGAALGGLALLPEQRKVTTVAAPKPSPAASRDGKLLQIARYELDRLGSAIPLTDMVAIVDFGLHSAQERIHFVDMEGGMVRSFYCTHGYGSDEKHTGWLRAWSNVPESLASSRGAYRTRGHYVGQFGKSMRLDGLDPSNDMALDRAIVMHPADYASPAHVAKWGVLGRSNGCFAMGPDEFRYALDELPNGRLLMAESYGIAADGSLVDTPDQHDLVLLKPDNPNTFERTNPGVF